MAKILAKIMAKIMAMIMTKAWGGINVKISFVHYFTCRFQMLLRQGR